MKISTAIKLIFVGAILLAIGIGIRAVRRYVADQMSPERVRNTLYAELTRSVDADVSIESARVDLDGVIYAYGVTLSPRGEEGVAFTCPEVRLGLNRLALLRGGQVVRKVTLISPTINLSYSTTDRVWNVEAIRLKETGAAPGEPPGDGIVVEDATLVVRNASVFGDSAPREYRGLHVALIPDEAGAGQWSLDGRILTGVLTGTRLSGWLAAGDPPQFGIEVSADNLRAGPQLWLQCPAGGLVWHDHQVRGRLGFRGAVTSTEAGPLDYSFTFDLAEGEVKTKFYPTRLRSVSGSVQISSSDIVIRDVAGVIEPEEFDDTAVEPRAARVQVTGRSSLAGAGDSFEIVAVDLPLCRTTIEGIPSIGTELWERLEPTGSGRLLLTLATPPEGETHFTAVTELSGVTLRPSELPLPLEEVAGTIVADNEEVRLQDVRGVIVHGPGQEGRYSGGAAPFALEGFVDYAREKSIVHATVQSITTNQELLKSIPTVGQEIWEMFRPEVVVDVSALLRDVPGSDEMSCTAAIDLHGGRAEPEFLTMPLQDATGTIRVEGGRVLIERLRATVDTGDGTAPSTDTTSTVEVQGSVDPEAEQWELYVRADDLALTESLLMCIPEAGEQIWAEAQPQGLASVSGKVLYDRHEQPALRYLLDIDLVDVSARPTAIPLPVDALSGQLLLSENRALSNSLVGVTCGGHFEGAAVVYYGSDGDLPSYGATLLFNQLQLAEVSRCVTRGQRDVRGRITGAIEMGGVLGQEVSRMGTGSLSLEEGQLWRTPFFAKLLGVLHLTMPGRMEARSRGDMVFSFSGDRVAVTEFDFTGGGLNLSGYGSVWLDGRLALTMVAVGAPEEGKGIPIISKVVGWLLKAVERQLVRLDVSGTLEEPVIEHRVLSKITWPLANLRSVLFSPIFGGGTEEEPEP